MRKVAWGVAFIVVWWMQLGADTSVWKVQKGKDVVYLGGTMHILRSSDFPLPKEFDLAYEDSKIVAFETDIGRLSDPKVQQQMMMQSVYTDGSTLDAHISPKTYKRLSDYCTANGFSIDQFKSLKPAMVVLAITSMELMKLGVSERGVDHFFYESAIADHKKIEAFESVQEQMHFIATMGEGNEDAFVRYAIEDLESIKEFYKLIVSAWRKGDDKKMYQKIVAEMKNKMPKVYQTLLLDRNQKWLPVIEAYFKTPQKEFVLVGAAHLVGPDGLLQTLKQKGYKVTKL